MKVDDDEQQTRIDCLDEANLKEICVSTKFDEEVRRTDLVRDVQRVVVGRQADVRLLFAVGANDRIARK